MDEYIKKTDVLNLLNRNSITKSITFSDGVSIYDSVKDLPAAEVVPSNEVDKLKGDIEVWKQNRFNLFQRLECYAMARKKVAREIFKDIKFEIHQLIFVPDETRAERIEEVLTEIEKKYT